MKSMEVYAAAATQLGVPPVGVLLVQASIAWHAFMAEQSAENATKAADYLQAYAKAAIVPNEAPKTRRRAAKDPALGAGYGEPGTVDQPVAEAQRRRRRPAVAPLDGNAATI